MPAIIIIAGERERVGVANVTLVLLLIVLLLLSQTLLFIGTKFKIFIKLFGARTIFDGFEVHRG